MSDRTSDDDIFVLNRDDIDQRNRSALEGAGSVPKRSPLPSRGAHASGVEILHGAVDGGEAVDC